MKTLIMAAMAAAAAAATAGIAEDTGSKPVLAAEVEMAPFAEASKKATFLGATINNPVVPTIVLTWAQQTLKSAYGAFRADAPMRWQIYVQTPAWDVAATNSDMVAMSDLLSVAAVYPSAEGPARTLLNHPGSVKTPDGCIHILAGEGRPDESFVKFSADGKTCAIASSAALAARALEDAAKRPAPAAGPLFRARLLPRGVSAAAAAAQSRPRAAAPADASLLGRLSALQSVRNERQMKLLGQVESAEIAIDIGTNGLDVAGTVAMKPGAEVSPAAGFSLPAGALDLAPAGAHLFAFSNVLLQSGYTGEKDFRDDMAKAGGALKALVEYARGGDEKTAKKYAAIFDSALRAVDAVAEETPFPAPSDWCGFSLAFDGARRPRLESVREAKSAAALEALGTRVMGDFSAALARQWPDRKLLENTAPGAWTVDWDAFVDASAADAGVKPGDDDAKDLESAKKTIATVLGGSKTILAVKRDGARLASALYAPEFAGGGAKPDGEARAAAAIPEIAADRPAMVFYMTPYAFVRDAVLPLAAKASDPEGAQQYETMAASMPPPAPGSALAGAAWSAKDGSARFLARVTANELKNLGVAFNAFTAASMSSALVDEDDDE